MLIVGWLALWMLGSMADCLPYHSNLSIYLNSSVPGVLLSN